MDATSGVIVAAELTNTAPDCGHLPGLVGCLRDLRVGIGASDADATIVSADAGYFSTENIAEDGAGLDLLIAAGREHPASAAVPKGGVWAVDVFGYDALRDVWVCPAGTRRTRSAAPGVTSRPAPHTYRADPADCAPCPLRARCLKPGQDQRVLDARRRRPTGTMRYKMRQPEHRRRYARRKAIVEPVFGQIKEDRGFREVSLRGLALAKAEYLLACLVHNLGKLIRFWPPGVPHAAATRS